MVRTKPITSPAIGSIPAGPCLAGVAVIVMMDPSAAVLERDSQGSSPMLVPPSLLDPAFVVNVFVASINNFLPELSRLSGC